VRIERKGYLPWQDTVSTRSGETLEVDAMLTRDGRAARAPSSAPPPPPPPPPTKVPAEEPAVALGTLFERGDAGVIDPKCVECPAAAYPEAARRRGVEGLVELSYVIDENGAVRDITVQESGGELFDDNVTRTVQKWRYQPATKDGVPVKIRWVQRFRFRRGR